MAVAIAGVSVLVVALRHGSGTTAAAPLATTTPHSGPSGPSNGRGGKPGQGKPSGNGNHSGKSGSHGSNPPAPAPPPPPPASVPVPRNRLLWGAWIGGHLTGNEAPWDMRAVAKFQRLAGKGLSVIHFSSPFAACRGSECSPYSFPVAAFENVRKYGAIPFFSWGSSSTPLQIYEPGFTLASLIDGSHDSYIRAWALAAKSWGHPFFLQFDWEMNGAWYPWGEGANSNRHGEFVEAWRHVHDIFTSVGATNATWVWCPNVDPSGSFTPLYSLYPGDAYVDWTCLDGYNRNAPWMNFDELYGSTYRLIERIAPSKPMIIGEIASTEVGGSKAAWITDVLSGNFRARYPQIRGILWFEKYAGNAYPIETSKSSLRAFVRGIASPAFESNVYSRLAGRKVKPPGA